MAEKPSKWEGIERRTVLKGLGVGAIGAGGAVGVASAHHVADLAVECDNPDDFPQTAVMAGESFDAKVHFQSGHGTEACFVAAISNDGGSTWTKVGENVQSGLGLGDHVHFNLTSDIPQDTEGGDYTWRVSATERPVPGQFCPHPGEDDSERSFVKWHDCALEILPPVEVQEVEFKGCSEVWVAFERFPVEEIDAAVNINGNWNSITIRESDLTKIPGQYGHDTPVYKHSVDNGDKLVGFRIVGDQYDNDHRCAENV